MHAVDAAAQAQFLQRCRTGDLDAIGSLYDHAFPRVYGLAYRLSGNHHDAEDITSETFARAFRKLDAYESTDVPFAAWLLRITRNVAFEQMRDQRRHSAVPLDTEVAVAGEHDAVDASQCVADMMQRLSCAQREVVALRLAGYKIREIAQILNKAEGTVKALNFAAMRNLRTAIAG
jgi:RNA polymerase sigma factor (sigma-70 family)